MIVAQIVAVDPDRAGGRIVKPQDERENGALARAARADERVGFAGLDPQVQVVSRRRSRRWRSERST